jgi:hypothetical protein
LSILRVLERLAAQRGLPESIVMDNGPEFTSKALDAWAHAAGVKEHGLVEAAGGDAEAGSRLVMYRSMLAASPRAGKGPPLPLRP